MLEKVNALEETKTFFMFHLEVKDDVNLKLNASFKRFI